MVRAVKKAEAQPAAPSIVGWNGIYLETPAGWEMAAVSGEMTRGNLRVDGPGDIHIRVKWQHTGKKSDIEFNLKRYLKTIEKSARKRGTSFECDTNLVLPVHGDQAKRKPRFFSWRGEAHAIGMIWYCSICGRTVIAQVDGPPKKNLTLIATQVLGSLDDHAIDGCHTWGVYGLSAEIPADFTLAKSRLLSGYLQMVFSRGASTIVLERWGLADVTLKKVTLEEWTRANNRKALKMFRCEIEPAAVRDHEGIAIRGSLAGLRDQARAAAMRMARMKPVERLAQYVWACEETNRICSVHVQHSRQEEGLAEEVAASFVCHTG